MAWKKIKSYRIICADNSESFYSGRANNYFAYNMLDLTHLASGMKIGTFRSEDDCERVGDYLSANFAAELAAIKSAIGRKTLNNRHVKNLPQMQEFLNKVKIDTEFLQMMDELQLKKEEQTDERSG